MECTAAVVMAITEVELVEEPQEISEVARLAALVALRTVEERARVLVAVVVTPMDIRVRHTKEAMELHGRPEAGVDTWAAVVVEVTAASLALAAGALGM